MSIVVFERTSITKGTGASRIVVARFCLIFRLVYESMGLELDPRELDPRGDAERPPLGVSRPAGEAERLGDLELRLPLPFPLGT